MEEKDKPRLGHMPLEASIRSPQCKVIEVDVPSEAPRWHVERSTSLRSLSLPSYSACLVLDPPPQVMTGCRSIPPTWLLRIVQKSLAPTRFIFTGKQGDPAESSRAQLLAAQGTERAKVLETFIGSFVGGFTLTKASIGNLNTYDQMLVLNYQFVAPNYAQTAGDLLLLRPRVIGGKGSTLLEEKERKYPVEFDTATLQTDLFDLTLPQGYVPDELPPPLKIDYDFAAYSSKVEMVSGNVLRYARTYQVKDVVVPASRLGDLKRFYRQILTDENSAAVFKKAGS
jgi:hypothetical protein